MKKFLTTTITLFILFISIIWVSDEQLGKFHAHAQTSHLKSKQASLAYNPIAQGPYTVQGNTIVGANGQQYIFYGVARDGLQYDCNGDGHFTQQELSYMGSGTDTASATYWGANTVRLPLSEAIWLNGLTQQQCTAAQYQALIKQTVDTLTALKLNVILDLHWSDAGRQVLTKQPAGGPWAMPDADSVTFWQQVAGIYSSYTNVLFELFNEPHPQSWSCWAISCTISQDNDAVLADKALKPTYTSVGMQALVDTVRSSGATNLVIIAGMDWGFNLSGISTNQIHGSNIVYDTHPYQYPDKMPSTWDTAFGKISMNYPVISTESGEYDCGTNYMNQLLSYFDAHRIGWIGWAWVVNNLNCQYPLLISNYTGTPFPGMGQLIYQHLRGYSLGSPPPVPFGPVNKTWYFAEGRVGGGFKEYLTLGNPDPVNSCSVTVQYLPEHGSLVTKTVTIPPFSRQTSYVDDDMHVTFNQSTGLSVSTIVSVSTTSHCAGVTAERPMYFNYRQSGTNALINSGSDVVGATHTSQSFYFADVPSGGGYSSYITILNAPGGSTASVTATYYANGTQVGIQNVQVPTGTRATIAPGAIRLPQHSAVVVTSTQPVVVERPSYFYNVNGGNAGVVTGAASVIGTQALQKEWLFAEGYTGGHFQTDFVISNTDTTANTAATVTINLEYADGAKHSFQVNINPMSQLIWNVNMNGVGATTPEVSADILSTVANIVVEREMFFQYNHAITSNKITTNVVSAGVTDVTGQGMPVHTASSFAEGYTNRGYNEWLTLQNPTANGEVIYLTLVNGYGHTHTTAISIGANSRSTLDIATLVMQKLAQPTDGSPAYEISMTMQTASPTEVFVAERPMYWNTGNGGTQGGSDVVGYTGY